MPESLVELPYYLSNEFGACVCIALMGYVGLSWLYLGHALARTRHKNSTFVMCMGMVMLAWAALTLPVILQTRARLAQWLNHASATSAITYDAWIAVGVSAFMALGAIVAGVVMLLVYRQDKTLPTAHFNGLYVLTGGCFLLGYAVPRVEVLATGRLFPITVWVTYGLVAGLILLMIRAYYKLTAWAHRLEQELQ